MTDAYRFYRNYELRCLPIGAIVELAVGSRWMHENEAVHDWRNVVLKHHVTSEVLSSSSLRVLSELELLAEAAKP